MDKFSFRVPVSGDPDPDRDPVRADGGYSSNDSDGSAVRQRAHAGPSHIHFHHHYHHDHHYHIRPGQAQWWRYPPSPAPPAYPGGDAGSYRHAEADLGPAQDPLTLWHSANAGTDGDAQDAAGATSAWMAGILDAHGVGQEWSRRHTTLASSLGPNDDDDEFSRYNPHWDDMITFRQTRARVPRERAWSASSGAASLAAAAAAGHASARGKRRLLAMATNTVGRTACLTVLPVAAVLAWCAVPLKTDIVVNALGEREERLNFWFFLLFYYGIYNAVALALVTQIFHVYSLTWWPRSMSGLLANVISWVFTTVLGALVYTLGTGIERSPMTWTSLTLLTLLLPVVISFTIIQRHHRRSTRPRRYGGPGAA
ncbi:hypothetical protein H4R19_003849, partial [Coemansia spiralis]